MFGILLSRVVLECVNRGLGSVNSVCSSLRVFFFFVESFGALVFGVLVLSVVTCS